MCAVYLIFSVVPAEQEDPAKRVAIYAGMDYRVRRARVNDSCILGGLKLFKLDSIVLSGLIRIFNCLYEGNNNHHRWHTINRSATGDTALAPPVIGFIGRVGHSEARPTVKSREVVSHTIAPTSIPPPLHLLFSLPLPLLFPPTSSLHSSQPLLHKGDVSPGDPRRLN